MAIPPGRSHSEEWTDLPRLVPPLLALSDDQRRKLAAKGKRLGRLVLGAFATIVTPDTILR